MSDHGCLYYNGCCQSSRCLNTVERVRVPVGPVLISLYGISASIAVGMETRRHKAGNTFLWHCQPNLGQVNHQPNCDLKGRISRKIVNGCMYYPSCSTQALPFIGLWLQEIPGNSCLLMWEQFMEQVVPLLTEHAADTQLELSEALSNSQSQWVSSNKMLFIFFPLISVAQQPNTVWTPSFLVFLDYTHTHTHTPGGTPLNAWSSRNRGLYLQNTQQKQEANIHYLRGIRTRVCSNQRAADLRLRPHGHWGRLLLYTHYNVMWLSVSVLLPIRYTAVSLQGSVSQTLLIVDHFLD